MLKKITAAVLCVLSLTSSGVYAETVQTGNNLTFDTAADTKIAASYKEDGSLAGVQLFNTDSGTVDYTQLLNGASGKNKIKIFSWKGESFEPVSPVIDNIFAVPKPDTFNEQNSIYNGNAAQSIAKYKPLCFYDTEYALADGVNTENTAKLYVNGTNLSWNESNISKYIVNNTYGKLALVDNVSNGDTNTVYYDELYVTAYTYARITDIDKYGDADIEVYDNGEIYYSFLSADTEYSIGGGKTYADLKEGDVLQIEYDRTKTSLSENISHIDVLTKAAEGKCTAFDDKDMTYTILSGDSSADYPYAHKQCGTMVGSQVVLYADDSGKIVFHEHLTSGKKIAVLDDIMQIGDEYRAHLILFDGTEKNLYVTNENAQKFISILNDESGNKYDAFQRVISYKETSAGYLNYADKLEPVSGEGTAYSDIIGNLRINSASKLMVLGEDGTLNSVTPAKLSQELTYAAYAYDKLCDGKYSYMIIKAKPDGYNDNTQTAVFVKSYNSTNNDGNPAAAITVLYKSAECSYLLSDSITADGINKGDVIVFALDSDDEIIRLDKIADMQLCSGSTRVPYENRGIIVPVSPKEWDKAYNQDTDVMLMYGRIVDKTSNSFTLVPADKDITASGDEVDFDICDDTAVYVYSYEENAASALHCDTASMIIKTNIPYSAKDSDTDDINWTNSELEWSTNYAFVKSVFGEAREVVVVIGPGSSDY